MRDLDLSVQEMVDVCLKSIIGSAYKEYHSDKPSSLMKRELFFLKIKICGLDNKTFKPYKVSNQFEVFGRWIITPYGKWRNVGKNKWYTYKSVHELLTKLTEGKSLGQTLVTYEEYKIMLNEVNDFISKEVKEYQVLTGDYKSYVKPKESYGVHFYCTDKVTTGYLYKGEKK